MVADNIRVAIRIRPLNQRELDAGSVNYWTIQDDSIFQKSASEAKVLPGTIYTFDKIFGGDVQTRDIHEVTAKDIILSCMNGVNGTIFAYGQTSSGKTFTMQGDDKEPGIIASAVRDIFQYVLQAPDQEFLLRVSYLEIYNEKIRDLLNPENDNLKIHENPNREIFVGNLSESIVLSPEEVLQLMQRGERNRHVGETSMNERSSRSHTIFRMVIESREKSSKKDSKKCSLNSAVKVSCLNLVDLAGSERISQSGAEGLRLKEGAHINKSLLTLGTVIAKLSEGTGDRGHIPYRDSKLTRILQLSLGGNARTAIICTITPASGHAEETISTLKFANRAKRIENRPEVNEVLSDEALLQRYRKEINKLKKQLDDAKNQNAIKEKSLGEKITLDSNLIGQSQEMLQNKEGEERHLRTHYEELKRMILTSSHLTKPKHTSILRKIRRQTWAPESNNDYVKKPDENNFFHGNNKWTFSKPSIEDFQTLPLAPLDDRSSRKRSIILSETSLKAMRKYDNHEINSDTRQLRQEYESLLAGIQVLITDNEGADIDIPQDLMALKSYMELLRSNLKRTQCLLEENAMELDTFQKDTQAQIYDAVNNIEESIKLNQNEMFSHKASVSQNIYDDIVDTKQSLTETYSQKDERIILLASQSDESGKENVTAIAEKISEIEDHRTEGQNEVILKLEEELKEHLRVRAQLELQLQDTRLSLVEVELNAKSVEDRVNALALEKIQHVENEKTRLQKTISELMERSIAADKQIEVLKSRDLENSQVMKNLRMTISKFECEISEKKSLLVDLEKSLGNITEQDRSEIHNLVQRNEQLQQKLVLQQSLNEQLKKSLKDTEENFAELREVEALSKNKFQILVCENDNLHAQVKLLSKVKKESETTQAELTEKEAKYQSVCSQLHDVENKLATLSTSADQIKCINAELDGRIYDLQATLENRDFIITNLKIDITAREEDRVKVKELEDLLKSKVSQLASAEEEFSIMKNQLEHSRQELMNSNCEALCRLDEQLQAAHIELQQKQEVEEELRSKLEAIESELALSQSVIQSIHTATELKVNEFAVHLHEKTEELSRSNDIVQNLQEQLERTTEELVHTRKMISESQREPQVFQGQVEDELVEKTSFQKLNEQLAMLKCEYSEAMKKYEQLISELNTKIEVDVSLRQTLNEDIDYLSNELSDYKQLKSERRALKEELEIAHQSINSLEDVLKRLEEEAKQGINDRIAVEKALSNKLILVEEERTAFIRSHNNEVSDLQGRIQSLQDALEKAHQEINLCMDSKSKLQDMIRSGEYLAKNYVEKLISDLEDQQGLLRSQIEARLIQVQTEYETVQCKLTESQKDLEIVADREQTILAKIDRGEFIDVEIVKRMNMELEKRWNDEKIQLETKLSNFEENVALLNVQIHTLQNEVSEKVQMINEIDSKFKRGEILHSETVLIKEKEMETMWQTEREKYKRQIESLEHQICQLDIILVKANSDLESKTHQQKELEESKNVILAQLDSERTNLMSSMHEAESRTISKLQEAEHALRKAFEEERAKYQVSAKNLQAQLESVQANFEKAINDNKVKDQYAQEIGAQLEKEKVKLAAFKTTELRNKELKLQELEIKNEELSRTKTDSSRIILQLQQRLHQSESDTDSLRKELAKYDDQAAKQNREVYNEAQVIASKTENHSNMYLTLTSLRSEMARMTVDRDEMKKNLRTIQMMQNDQITKNVHLEATCQRLTFENEKLKKENDQLNIRIEEFVGPMARTNLSCILSPLKIKHTRTRHKENNPLTANSNDEIINTKVNGVPRIPTHQEPFFREQSSMMLENDCSISPLKTNLSSLPRGDALYRVQSTLSDMTKPMSNVRRRILTRKHTEEDGSNSECTQQ